MARMGRGRVRRNGRGGWERATAERDSASCGCIAVVTASSQCRRVYSRLQYRERERERERERDVAARPGQPNADPAQHYKQFTCPVCYTFSHVVTTPMCTPMPRLPASILSVPRSGQDVMHRSRAFLHTSNAGYLFETKPAGKHAAASDGSSDQCIINHARNLLPFFVPKDRDCAGTSWIARGPRAVELTLEDPLICRRRKRL